LDEKLNTERDMEMENIMADTEKTAVKRTGETQETETEIENKMEESESIADLYQNHCNTCQMDGKTILYTFKRRKLNQE
jgi:hypothetical protein